MQSCPREREGKKEVYYPSTFCIYAMLCKKWAIEHICLYISWSCTIGERDRQISVYLHTYLSTMLCKILVMSCRGQCNREIFRTRPNLWSVKPLDFNLYTAQDYKGPVNTQGCPCYSLRNPSDPHPPYPAPIIPITATFSDKCKVVQNVSQPARKCGQGRDLTVSLGSIKCYCVCRQLLTVHFVSVWGGQLWRKKQRENGGRWRRGVGGWGGVIKCMTYVPFILIPSKEPGLIKLTSDALFSPLINGCGNHAKMH